MLHRVQPMFHVSLKKTIGICSPNASIGRVTRYFHRSVGLVGMPNVGKSTLFNALTKTQQAQAANYPFCTIEPNIARVCIPDKKLTELAKVEDSGRIIEAQLEFVDIAGLVKGASQGAGLGNKFLDNIRQVSVVAHVLRCYEDVDVLHVEETIDPIRDMEIIENELILADLQTVERRMTGVIRKAKSGDKESREMMSVLEIASKCLEEGNMANTIQIDGDSEKILHSFNLLTRKNMLYICNVNEDDCKDGNSMTKAVEEKIAAQDAMSLIVSAGLEAEAATLDDEESQLEFLNCYGLQETGLSKVIRSCRDLLRLQTYYTVGPKEARAWNVPFGTKAPQAAGVIHSDFERLFIRAEVVTFQEFLQVGGMKAAKDKGIMRTEGKDYICKDGDVFNFLVGK